MRVYENYSLWAQEFSIDAALELKSDGRFHYNESWHCYGAGFSRNAHGNWRQKGDKIVLNFETADEGLYFSWTAGEELTAVVQTDSIDLGGNFSMSLRQDKPPQAAAPPKISEVSETIEKSEKINHSRVAKLYFKDGSVQERPLPNDSMFGLFTQTYYRLVDDEGKTTNLFEARQNAGNTDSAIAEYDEIEMPSSDGSNDFG